MSTNSPQESYNTAAIRKLLQESFDDEELMILCYDYFQTVYKKFSTGMTLSAKIHLLIDHCNRNHLFEKLLVRIKKDKPAKYAEFKDSLIVSNQTSEDPTSALPPAKEKPPNVDQSTKYHVFISHSQVDTRWVREELIPRLEEAGITHIDQHTIESGRPKRGEIKRAIDESRRTLLVLTPHYLQDTWRQLGSLDLSEWRTLLAIVQPCELPPRLNARTSVDLQQADEETWSRLIKALREPDHPHQRQRRVDAVVPHNAYIGQHIDLLVQVRLPDSPILGIDEWPTRQTPLMIEQRSAKMALEFPKDPRTGSIGPAHLQVRIVAPDFVVNGSTQQNINVPPDRDSNQILFLLTPVKAGRCRINIEIHSVDSLYLGTITVETAIGELATAPTKNIASIFLVVVVVEQKNSVPPDVHFYERSISYETAARQPDQELEGSASPSVPANQTIPAQTSGRDKVAEESPEGAGRRYIDTMLPVPPGAPQFYMAPCLVSNDLFRHFIRANSYWHPLTGACRKSKDVDQSYLEHWSGGEPCDQDADLPVTNISLRAAQAFASWLNGLSEHEIRLPTFEEWYLAANAGRTDWFDAELLAGHINFRDTAGVMRAVGHFPANPFGIHDLLGNAYDMCMTPSGSQSDLRLAGGCYYSTESQLREQLILRSQTTCPNAASFRCVRGI
jgi:hypothetical protein